MAIYKTDSAGAITKFASTVDIVDDNTICIDGALFSPTSGGGRWWNCFR